MQEFDDKDIWNYWQVEAKIRILNSEPIRFESKQNWCPWSDRQVLWRSFVKSGRAPIVPQRGFQQNRIEGEKEAEKQANKTSKRVGFVRRVQRRLQWLHYWLRYGDGFPRKPSQLWKWVQDWVLRAIDWQDQQKKRQRYIRQINF